MKKEPIKLISIKIWCPTLKKEVELGENDYYFHSSEQECEMCGSHGEIDLCINRCECGKYHDDLQIKSW